jgi:lipopolysaccharide biosynthesis protein
MQTRDQTQPEALSSNIRLIAFYLPQFHPIPENDEWWGQGFTEWTNVTKAKPRYPGHYQPHLPADLGYYDLRLPEAREAQADLAQQYGLHGFCYYHYWFQGRRLLERPFNEVLESGRPDFPFCLCWANEYWTRVWAGEEKKILIRWLVRAFEDRRYVRVEDKPIFLVYRAGDLPNAAQTAEIWRNEARRAGIGEIFLCAVQSNFHSSQLDPCSIGFDAAVEYQPSLFRPRSFLQKVRERFWRDLSGAAIIDYSEIVKQALQVPIPQYKWFRCVTPGWDNTARMKNGLILTGTRPQKYEEWLAATIKNSRPLSNGDRVVFINAWNEWAEGNHLEPCRRWGRSYLEATQEALDSCGSRAIAELRRAGAIAD